MVENNLVSKELEAVVLNNELYFKIEAVEAMRPFFMSIVSDGNHWLFVSSNGGVTAGRKNAEFSLFPYYTDDKITESTEVTGSKTIFQVAKKSKSYIWEPFSIRQEGLFKCTRNLYQNKWGNKIVFEEINHDLELSYRYQWSTSKKYGFVKQATLQNLGLDKLEINVLDGLQNILPYGVPSDLQMSTSNLVDAYKRSELVPEVGLGIYALSAIIVDRAEPAEALKANIVWSSGFSNPVYLLSSNQLLKFRNWLKVNQEEDIKGEKGAYFVNSTFELDKLAKKEWCFIANVNQNHANIVGLIAHLKENKNLIQDVLTDVEHGSFQLQQITASADGFQCTSDILKDTRHYFNVLFNIMRGGIFDYNYQIEKWDFEIYIKKANLNLYHQFKHELQSLNNKFTYSDLQSFSQQTNHNDFIRLATEYLPLKFSRRHGDPSRPWNKFSINTQSEVDGSKILDYQGNWRDIFQNWEALVHTYPNFIEGMISKFLNASTFDGYNPYRVTKDGFDWETIEPDNPWSYIGYWGDHQIIYLLKFLEFAESIKSGYIISKLNQAQYVYAYVPYKIKNYESILANSKNTIDFDFEAEKKIHRQKEKLGSDGALLTMQNGEICRVNFIEKILATTLSKLSNFIPEAGIWMNTQRPEWNDANNALVGNGVSMVTLYYLRRFLKFIEQIFEVNATTHAEISIEVYEFLQKVTSIFSEYKNLLVSDISNNHRKKIVDALGTAGSNYRCKIYEQSFSGIKVSISTLEVIQLIKAALPFVEHTIKHNKRPDGLYHAYNLIQFSNDELSISYLNEMLEGQVAVLSSGFLSAEESLEVLETLKNSSLYRADQNSYILYPNKQLPKFLDKNRIALSSINQSALLLKLVENRNTSIIEQDVNGDFHFNGNIKNADDIKQALQSLEETYQPLVAKEANIVLNVFEDVFNHKEFTGRSGTFFAYEGLGSIYWHMVSKLSLSAQETYLRAKLQKSDQDLIQKLAQKYYSINDGIGVHKSPILYGAFPIIPYSHTPLHKGAQQPGMTGQVKEDILTRLGELGININNQKLVFNPSLLKLSEFLTEEKSVIIFNVHGIPENLTIPAYSILFTYCQVPILYTLHEKEQVKVVYNDDKIEIHNELQIPDETTSSIMDRLGKIKLIQVLINKDRLNV